MYGVYQSSSLSRRQIEPFIEKFKIPMQEYQKETFKTFNDFFIRKFIPKERPFVQASHELPAFSEARYLAYEKITEKQKFPVKGSALSAVALMGSEEKAKPFIGGPLLLARLCPVDYHRFHFPDAGHTLEDYRIHGKLHSVNPMALKYKEDIFATNERHVSILQTENFGKIAFIEVGALCVGKIVQTFKEKDFKRGDEKGYFLFGASTVIVLGEPGQWTPDADLLDQTSRGRETLVRLGERVAAVSQK
jgi:phosphatidylserine decarboxylase